MGIKRGVWLLATVVVLLLPASAHAAFPGQNGKIAFVRAGDIWTMNPDGTQQTNLTNSAAVDANPAWSPDGAKVAFDSRAASGSDAGRRVFVMDSDGTDLHQLDEPTCSQCFDRHPSWSPDGTKISLIRCCEADDDDIVTVNSADGGGDTTVHASILGPITEQEWAPNDGWIAYVEHGFWGVELFLRGLSQPDARLTHDGNFNERPAWSPDAAWVAFQTDTAPSGISAIRPDGTGRHFIVSGSSPAWSPDGTKIAYGGVSIVNVDGTGSTFVASGSDPDWQPIPINSYPRPKGATPLRVSLTTAYEQCTSPDRTHGPPLAFGSCSSPQKTSAHLTVGTGDSNGLPARNEGYVRVDTIVGAPGGPDDADVGLQLFIDDVFTNALADYSGEVRAHLTLRITDRDNTPHPGGPSAATTTEIPLDLVATCAAVPDPVEGSVCSTSTTADALAPGTVKEGRRSIWQLGRVEVYDGGPDGDASTSAGDRLFAVQGLFVP